MPGRHMRGGLSVLLLAGLVCGPAASVAQNSDPAAQNEAREVKRLDLTDAQRDTIFISVTNQNFKNQALPNFQPRIGITVPVEIQLEDMPTTIAQLVPETGAFRIARILNLVVIVDPMDRRVVEVITGKTL